MAAREDAERTAQRPPTPRLALSKTEAAEALGVSIEFFDRYIDPEIPSVRRGRRCLYAVAEIEAWLSRAAT